MEIVQAMAGMGLFEGLSERELSQLSRGAGWRTYGPGEFVFHQGEDADSFHVLYAGVLKLFRSTAEGREQTVYLAEDGEPFCLCTLYGARSLPVSALTMAPCRVLVFAWERMEEQLRSSPRVLLNIVRILNTRLMHSYQMIEDLGLRSIHQRVASFLVHSARVRGQDAARVTLSVSRQEVAKILGTTPETVSRVLARLCNDGLIEARGREISILDLPALTETAG
ncbi:Crp/Fnr family transcriptional regulator [Desulfomicrobium salsuginis]